MVFTTSGEIEPGYLVALIAIGLFVFIIIVALLAGTAISPPMALPVASPVAVP